MHLLIIDNFDSFTCNLRQLAQEAGCERVTVCREKFPDPELASQSDAIILSPGPGLPSDYPGMTEVIRRFHRTRPLLGICLGHQAIAEFFGARLENLGIPAHGVTAKVCPTGVPDPIFRGVPVPFQAGLYHSWAVSQKEFPSCLEVTGVSETGVIMALSHRQYDVKGLQFHPESILTPSGRTLVSNWLSLH